SEVHKGVADNCQVVDRPIGALLTDLKQRGLLDDTLVVWGTEFGRTPVTQNSEPGPKAGRDHHRLAFSVWLAGGGVRGGQVVGATREVRGRGAGRPAPPPDHHAPALPP